MRDDYPDVYYIHGMSHFSIFFCEIAKVLFSFLLQVRQQLFETQNTRLSCFYWQNCCSDKFRDSERISIKVYCPIEYTNELGIIKVQKLRFLL